MTTAVNSQSYEVEIRERTDRQVLFILLAHIPVVGLLVPMGYGTTTFALVASLLVGGIAAAGYFTIVVCSLPDAVLGHHDPGSDGAH